MTRKLLWAFAAIMLSAGTVTTWQAMAQSPADPSSSHTATEVDQDREDRKYPADSRALREEPTWRAAGLTPDEIEFVCIHNPYMESQFKLWIADDVRGDGEELECKDPDEVVFPADNDYVAAALGVADVFKDAKNKGRAALWLITPTIAKILREVEFRSETNEFAVNSRRRVRFDVVAVELDSDSWAIGQVDKVVSKARFSLAANKILTDSTGDERGVRHRTESSDEHVYFELTDLHDAGKSALEPIVDQNSLDFVKFHVNSGNFHEY